MKLGRMGLLLAGLALCSAAGVSDATAAPVTFDTLSTELCWGAPGCGSVNQIAGNLQLRFTPNTATIDAAPTTFSSFGTITAFCVGAACNTYAIDGLRLYLRINQTGPTAASGLLGVGILTGSIASGMMLTFDPGTSLTLGDFTYTLPYPSLALMGPATNNGQTSLQTRVTYTEPQTPQPTPVPEPASMLLTAAGLGLVSMVRRRKAR